MEASFNSLPVVTLCIDAVGVMVGSDLGEVDVLSRWKFWNTVD